VPTKDGATGEHPLIVVAPQPPQQQVSFLSCLAVALTIRLAFAPALYIYIYILDCYGTMSPNDSLPLY
jgi:hypothetical protein